MMAGNQMVGPFIFWSEHSISRPVIKRFRAFLTKWQLKIVRMFSQNGGRNPFCCIPVSFVQILNDPEFKSPVSAKA
jgi:hypothetical protein